MSILTANLQAICQSIGQAANPEQQDEKMTGGMMIQKWAIKKVEGIVDKEAQVVSGETDCQRMGMIGTLCIIFHLVIL